MPHLDATETNGNDARAEKIDKKPVGSEGEASSFSVRKALPATDRPSCTESARPLHNLFGLLPVSFLIPPGSGFSL